MNAWGSRPCGVVGPRAVSPRPGAGVAVGCEADDWSSAGRLRTVFVEPGASAWTAQGRRIRASAMHKSARRIRAGNGRSTTRSEEHTSELQSQSNLVCRLLLEKK